jgi:hypothetical protein
LRLEFADEVLPTSADKNRFDMGSLVKVTNENDQITVSITLAKGATFVDKKKESREMGWNNRIPEQANCPDYDALHLPLIIRQDTISDTHPFKYDAVSTLVGNLKKFISTKCGISTNNNNFISCDALKTKLESVGLKMFPWFVYFVPNDSHKDFKFQPPKMPAKYEKDKEKIGRIAQVSVGFPTNFK